MSKYILVHGFDSNYAGCDPYRKFEAFANEIDSGEAELFRWGILSNLKFYNIFGLLNLYFREKKLAQDLQLQAQLIKQIQESKASIIVCHSMGCQLLYNTVTNFGLEQVQSVKQIYFVQADCGRKDVKNFLTKLEKKLNPKLEIGKEKLKQSLEPKVIQKVTQNVVENLESKTKDTIKLNLVFCPWDIALWESLFLNFRIPIGLFGYRDFKLSVKEAWDKVFKKISNFLGKLTKSKFKKMKKTLEQTVIYNSNFNSNQTFKNYFLPIWKSNFGNSKEYLEPNNYNFHTLAIRDSRIRNIIE